MEIITDLEKLGVRSDEIDVRKGGKKVQEIVLALKNTIREKGLVGLSAPQIGEPYRIFCLAFDQGKNIKTFINPIISGVDGFELSKETCSSIPGKTFIRPRHTKIQAMYLTPLGKAESTSLVGFAARVFQHHIDHLDGLLLSDVGLEVDKDFFDATDEERAEVIKAYLESLDIKEKEIKQEIEEDSDLKAQSDAIEYMQGVATGKIKVERVAEEFEDGKEVKDTNTEK